jgi:hypothetical protein
VFVRHYAKSKFDVQFQQSTLSERKVFIQKLIDRIDVDRGRNVVRCYLLRLPKGSGNIVDEKIENAGAQLRDVSPTGFGPVFSP